MASQKLSNYQFEKILLAFAEGRLAKDVKDRAPRTISYIFNLLRKRLVDVGYYQPNGWSGPLEFDEHGPSRIHPIDERYKKQAPRLRGSRDYNRPALLADMYFRAENPDLTPLEILQDVKLIVKVTGPINRPPANLDLWRKHHAIIVYKRGMLTLRRMAFSKNDNPQEKRRRFKFHQEQIAGYQEMIEITLAEIRAMRRKRN